MTDLLRRPTIRFVLHYIEMVLAMLAGMFLLAPLWTFLVPDLHSMRDAYAIVMATDMVIGMAMWMLIRRHSWPRIVEMSIAMFVPFAVLLVPYWLDVLSGDALMMLGHIIMFPTMLAVMLWRRAEYGH